MKTREEVVTLIEVILMQEEADYKAYEVGRLGFRDYQRYRRDFKNRLDMLLWVIGYRGCYFTPCSIEETFNKARYVVEGLSNDDMTLEELLFN